MVHPDALYVENSISFQKNELCPNLENWIRTYEKGLLSIAFSIVKDPQLAQDCVQESFIKAALKINQLKNKEKIFPWLYSIVVNECKSQLRSKWFKKIFINDESTKIKHWDKYPSLEISELYEHVLRLPDKLKMPIILYYYNDLSISEIALTLKVNETTCRVWLHRAKQRLKKMLEEGEPKW